MVMTRDSRGRDTRRLGARFQRLAGVGTHLLDLSFVFNGSFNVGEVGRVAENYPGSYVSANFNRMLGISPQLGRDFTPAEDKPGADPVALISANVWKQRYGGILASSAVRNPSQRCELHDVQ